MNRREFLQSATIAAASFLLPPEIARAPEGKLPRIRDILWLHDTPTGGGSINPRKAFEDAERLRAKGFVVLGPSNEWITVYKNYPDMQFISRLILEHNDFTLAQNQQRLARFANRLTNAGITNAIVQPFNEVNRAFAETNNVYISPEHHVSIHLLPAAETLAQHGFKTLITPLAEEANLGDVSEEDYFSRILETIKAEKSPEWIKDNLLLGLHAYALYPQENPIIRVKNAYERMKTIFGFALDVHVTEGGVYQNEHTHYDSHTIEEHTQQLLLQSVPTEIPLRSYALWLYANFAQRSLSHREIEENNPEVTSFEKSALIGVEGETTLFKRIEGTK